jgi:predicted CXXCH cytochrome family protein
MKKSLLLFFIALASVFPSVNHSFIVNAAADQGQITLHYPPDKIVLEYGLLNISLELPLGTADNIKVNNNGREVLSIVPDEEHECFSLPLNLGLNSVTIYAAKGSFPVFERTVNVFQRSDLESAYTKPPADFQKDYFHMKDLPKCAECHTMEPKESDGRPVLPSSFATEDTDREAELSAASTCYSCHKHIASSPYVHGPVAVWSCLSCHETDSEPRYAVKKPDTEVCFGCHKEQKDEWETKEYSHGPVTIGKCVICHSPHSSDYPFNLYKAPWDLCVNCHAEKANGKHVLGDSFSTEGHPTKDRKDPVRIGRELSCASCHNPHASDFPHLWAFNVHSMFELCTKCHFDKNPEK